MSSASLTPLCFNPSGLWIPPWSVRRRSHNGLGPVETGFLKLIPYLNIASIHPEFKFPTLMWFQDTWPAWIYFSSAWQDNENKLHLCRLIPADRKVLLSIICSDHPIEATCIHHIFAKWRHVVSLKLSCKICETISYFLISLC